ncbi:unnamed protein product [Pleuronectes platessa]|uniref:Uncharacterized protein n=1 Tax=Pleuronectes platessa TaxID=8262 RepID=A0A9N7YCH0_PLEPL|nr:unnamed protein product [Pleuronectes platessa]
MLRNVTWETSGASVSEAETQPNEALICSDLVLHTALECSRSVVSHWRHSMISPGYRGAPGLFQRTDQTGSSYLEAEVMTGQPGRFTGEIPPAWGSGPISHSCLEHNPAFLTGIQTSDIYYDGKLNLTLDPSAWRNVSPAMRITDAVIGADREAAGINAGF